MKKGILVLGIALVCVLSFSGTASAIGEIPPTTIPDIVTSAGNFVDLLDNIVDWIFVVVMVFAAIYIVLAGFAFITGGGDPQSVAGARNKLLYAAIGIIVAVLSRGIIKAIISLIGG